MTDEGAVISDDDGLHAKLATAMAGADTALARQGRNGPHSGSRSLGQIDALFPQGRTSGLKT